MERREVMGDRADIRLRNMDCLEALRDMRDNEFELAIVDPPYGIGMDSRRLNGRSSKGRHAVIQSQYADKIYDDAPPTREYFEQLKRVSKNRIIWGANHFISHMPFDSAGWIAWAKNGQSIAPCNSDFELAFSSFDKCAKMFTFD